METVMDHIGADGVFTEGFSKAITTELGEGYVETQDKGRCKILDDVTDVKALAKVAIDSRRQSVELSEQVKKGLSKPADTASDEDKSAYKKMIRTESGASEDVSAYVFAKPDNLPEGMPYSEEAAKKWAQVFCDLGVPVEAAQAIIAATYEQEVAKFKTAVTDKQQKESDERKAYDKDVTDIREKHQPDDIKVMGRQVVKFIGEEGGDDVTVDGATKKGLKTMVTEKGMFNTPDDFGKWKEIGVSPSDFLFFARMGKIMSAGVQRETSPGVPMSKERAAAIAHNKVNANSPDLQIEVPAA